MHKRLLNQAKLAIVLKPRGPMLVKSGLETPDPTRPGMEFVRTRHEQLGATVYLPGTSLKGAIRNHSESILRGLRVRVCNPFDKEESCRSIPAEIDGVPVCSDHVFREQCAACRTFGSLKLAGRAQILDAYPWPADADATKLAEVFRRTNATETRWQVGISRKTGQAQNGALFDLEVVVGGEFHTEVHLRNFQLWQLGLLAAVLHEMDEGYVPVGFGKFRGLGQVGVEFGRLEIVTSGRETSRLCGAGELFRELAASQPGLGEYALHADDTMDLEGLVDFSANGRIERIWRGSILRLEGEERDRLLAAVVAGPLTSYVQAPNHHQPAVGVR